jgi:hypothetical protein
MATPRSLLRIEILAPALLVITGLADVGLRFLPLDRLSFRAWEAIRVGGEDGPFRPNQRYENARAYGDLANMGNLRELREYHAEVVVTDAAGYRNPSGLGERGEARVVVTGTSFTAGTEVGEDENLAARLTARLGVPVYNAALADPDLTTLRGIARRVGAMPGVLVFEYLEGREAPTPAVGGAPRPLRCPLGVGDASSPICRAFNHWYERARVSPVRVAARRALRLVQDDRLFPNPDRNAVLRARLRGGPEMLFQGTDAAWRPAPTTIAAAERYFTWLERRLRRDGVRLLVVLAPRKYTVYGPLVDGGIGDVDTGARLLTRIAQRLTDRGVPVVDLTPALRAAARDSLAAGRYVYFLDDTHWNARGIAVAADTVAAAVARLGTAQTRK